MDLERKSGGYVVLQRQADSDRQLWQSLLQQQKELQVVSNSRSNNVQVMDRAEAPGAPFSQRGNVCGSAVIIASLAARALSPDCCANEEAPLPSTMSSTTLREKTFM
jgi:uncharacterized protein involved in exopolysaccharide biosynthesis